MDERPKLIIRTFENPVSRARSQMGGNVTKPLEGCMQAHHTSGGMKVGVTMVLGGALVDAELTLSTDQEWALLSALMPVEEMLVRELLGAEENKASEEAKGVGESG